MSFYREKRVTTRKPHYCSGCGKAIPVGTNVTYASGVFDGDFFAYYLCDPCKEFLDTHPDYFNDGYWGEGEIGEARREEEQDLG